MVYESSHPLVRSKVTMLRNVKTAAPQFRQLVRNLAQLIVYEAAQDLEVAPMSVTTPMGDAPGARLKPRLGLVPILRAGLGMVEGALDMLPDAEVWHIGLYRDEETLQPVWYYNKLPGEPTIDVALIIDPMLATGGSAVATISEMKNWGVEKIKFLCLIAAPEGIEAVEEAHPDVPIHTAAVDSHLNEIGYIVPGLGDAGDRQFRTE